MQPVLRRSQGRSLARWASAARLRENAAGRSPLPPGWNLDSSLYNAGEGLSPPSKGTTTMTTDRTTNRPTDKEVADALVAALWDEGRVTFSDLTEMDPDLPGLMCGNVLDRVVHEHETLADAARGVAEEFMEGTK